MIKSILILEKPISLARSNARRVSSTVCLRPILKKRLFIHRLRIDRDPADSVITQHGEFFSRDCIWPAGFYCRLAHIFKSKSPLHCRKHPVQLSRLQRCRRSAAHIKASELPALHKAAAGSDLLHQRLRIPLHRVSQRMKIIRNKRTIRAPGRAERDPNIQIQIRSRMSA